MNIHELREAQARFENRIDDVIAYLDEKHIYRKEVVKYFSISRFRELDIKEYALGEKHEHGEMNFCYALERQLSGLGRIVGATAYKFGVYYGKNRSDPKYEYRFTKKYGNNAREAFTNVKYHIHKLLLDGNAEDLKALALNPISTMFKGKILSTYYPERYLNVFSDEHLEYFLIQLNLDFGDILHQDAVYKREALLTFKNADPIMKNWRVDVFAHFLYNEYPGHPYNKEHDDALLKDYKQIEFPAVGNIEFISQNIVKGDENEEHVPFSKKASPPKTDYEKEARKLKQYGDRGEKIVEEYERERLIKAGKHKLAKEVDRVSLKSDSFGYDILSFDVDGTPLHIEVKATSSKVGNTNFFITANEMQTAISDKHYHIYMVYDILSKHPKIWDMGNIFNPENKNISKKPMTYRISITTEKK